MEHGKIVGIIKEGQRKKKRQLTTVFKRIKDSRDRLEKSRTELDMIPKIRNDIDSSLDKCNKKSCIQHETKLQEKILKNIKDILNKVQSIEKITKELEKKVNQDGEHIEKVEQGALHDLYDALKQLAKCGQKIYIYAEEDISRETDSLFNNQKEYIYRDKVKK